MTLLVNRILHGKYKKFCKKEGLIMSRQVEKFMKAHMKKGKDRNVLGTILEK